MMMVSERSRNIIILSLLLSFLAHTTIYLGMDRLPDWTNKLSQNEPIEFEVHTASKKRRSKKRAYIKDFDLEKQLENTKKKANYLSRKTRRVKKQTIASQSGLTQNRTHKVQKKLAQKKRSKNNKKSKGRAKSKDLNGVFPSYISDQFNAAPKGRNYQSGLNLTKQSVSTISNHIPNVEKANITAINTDQGMIKYYAFYMRLHEQLYPRWSNNIERVITLLQPKEYNYLTLRARTTVLEVILNSKGEYLGHILVKSSSNRMLDFAAIDAFKRASPFINPPTDLIEDDQKIYIPFAFNIQLTGRKYAKGN